ncbi:MAG TPA: hypothetical protein VJB96_04730 [Patescibacteria group bacterium]|nr:hypothetical protein [Patescibacteria group bacterium]
MDFSEQAITYALLIIPTLFAFTVIGQGLSKLVREEKDGPVALGVGVFLLLLIGITYWTFIR